MRKLSVRRICFSNKTYWATLLFFVFVQLPNLVFADGSSQGTQGTCQPTASNPECYKECVNVKGDGSGSGGGFSCNFQQSETYRTLTNQYATTALKFASMAPQMACSQWKVITADANAAITAFNVACKSAVDSCISKCSAAGSDPATATASAANATLCKNFGAQVSNPDVSAIMVAIANNNTSMDNCDQHQKMTNNGSSNPSGQNLPKDCTNPTFALSNPVCQGQHNGGGSSGGGGTTVGAPSSSGGGTPISGISGTMGGFDMGPVAPDPANKSSGGPGTPNYGGGGGGGLGGGGGASGSGKKKPGSGSGAEPRDTKIYGGLIQGSSGAGGAGTGNAPYSGGGRGVFGQQFANQQNDSKKAPDLSKYAPNMNYAGRGVAGATGPDGITGPNSNLFEKVNKQYTNQSSQNRMFEPAGI